MNINNIGKITETGYKLAHAFVRSQENLSSTRFIQDTVTNWMPKAVFSRSKADFAEMSFLEFIESAIFYFASPILGEMIFRNGLFKAIQPKEIQKNINNLIPKSVSEITKNNNISDTIKNSAITTKAGILLACLAIPVAEYTLSFAKNLFTLKMFHKSNFNNIAALNKNEKEDKKQQEKVEKSSKKHLKRAAVISLGGITAGLLMAKYGAKNKTIVNVAKNILEPGKALLKLINPKNNKIKNALSSFSLDFADNNGKLALSKGQLGLTALVGLFGYSAAASDRGKLDVLEVWTRVPLVVLYTTFGSEWLEKGFIKMLSKKDSYKDLIQKDKFGKLSVPKLEELPQIATKLASKNKIDVKEQYKKLLKQKTFTTAIPYAFSMIVMGFILSAMTRFWTQYRYNHSKNNNQEKNSVLTFNRSFPKAFKAFEK